MIILKWYSFKFIVLMSHGICAVGVVRWKPGNSDIHAPAPYDTDDAFSKDGKQMITLTSLITSFG